MTIGNVIKAYREALGLSQDVVSKRAGVSQGTVSRIEANRQQPSGVNLTRIAHVLQCRVEDILNATETENLVVPAVKEPETNASRFLIEIRRLEPLLTPEQQAIVVKVVRAFAMETSTKRGLANLDGSDLQ